VALVKKTRRFGGTYRLPETSILTKRYPASYRTRKHLAYVRFEVYILSVRRLLVTADVIPILVTLMIEELRFSEMLVLTKATRHNITEDGSLQHPACF
jgi:hypothetical protein